MTLGTVHENSPEVQEMILHSQVDAATFVQHGGLAPGQIEKPVKNEAPPPQTTVAPVSTLRENNVKREAAATEGLKQTQHSLSVLDKMQKGTLTSGAERGMASGAFARSASIPGPKPAAFPADMGGASSFRSAAATTDKPRNPRDKDKGVDTVYNKGAVPGTMYHAMLATMNPTAIDRQGAAAFEGASRKMGRGAAGIHDVIAARGEETGSNLRNFTHLQLKSQLEGMQSDLLSSRCNSIAMAGTLGQRKENGVVANAATVMQAFKTGGSMNASGMVFGRGLSA